MSSVLIEVKNLKKYFHTKFGTLHAVDDVSFTIERGRTMGIVGESGCGKSTLGRTMIHLLEPTDGQIFLNGEDISHVRGRKLKEIHEKMQIIFQDPYSSLNPRRIIEATVKEPLRQSGRFSKGEIEDRADELMEQVGIDNRMRYSYPSELDGGRRQRVGIARAISMNPDFIVCDEPVSALDVSIQAQVLNLLMELQEKLGTSYLFVTHDLSVVRHISQEICVMYLGNVVERAATADLFENQIHPYTKALLSAVPSINIDRKVSKIKLQGEVTSPINPKPGCRFAPRCPYVKDECAQPQTLTEVAPNHFVACCRCKEIG